MEEEYGKMDLDIKKSDSSLNNLKKRLKFKKKKFKKKKIVKIPKSNESSPKVVN